MGQSRKEDLTPQPLQVWVKEPVGRRLLTNSDHFPLAFSPFGICKSQLLIAFLQGKGAGAENHKIRTARLWKAGLETHMS